MECPRCHAPSTQEMLQEFGGVCPKCLLAFVGEKDAPSFPNLEIIELIGQGGMGVVYKAIQKNLNRTVVCTTRIAFAGLANPNCELSTLVFQLGNVT